MLRGEPGQILALLGREGFCKMTHLGHPIQLFVRASTRGGTDERTLSGRTQPIRAGLKRNRWLRIIDNVLACHHLFRGNFLCRFQDFGGAV
jgi:hypothetical protein